MTVIMLHGVFICHVLDQILYFYRVKLQGSYGHHKWCCFWCFFLSGNGPVIETVSMQVRVLSCTWIFVHKDYFISNPFLVAIIN